VKTFFRYYDKFEEYLLVYSLVLTVIIVFVQVIMRYIFNHSLSWSEELTRYIFIYQVWLGGSLGVKESKHIRVEIIYDIFKGRGRYLVDLVAMAIFLAFCVFLTINSAGLVQLLFQRHSLSTGLRLPLGYAYAAVPIGCGMMALRLLGQIYDDLMAFLKPEGGQA